MPKPFHPASPTTKSTSLSLDTTFWKPSLNLWSPVVAMAPAGWRIMICSASFVTFALVTASTSLIIIDAATLRMDLPYWKVTAIAAIIFDILLLFSIVFLTVSVALTSRQWTCRRLLPWIAALLAVIAASLSIVSLVLKKTTLHYGLHLKTEPQPKINVDVQIALWTLAAVAELTFYTLISIHWSSCAERRLSFIAEKTARRRTPPAIPERPATPLRMIAPPYALPEAGAPAPDFDVSQEAKERRSKENRRSWRDSLHLALRPRNSQRELLRGSRSSFSRDSSMLSDTRSIATTVRSDGFDSWDTSNVDLSLREALSPIPTRGRTLETIPGSRPSSPGKPLEGPFSDSPDSSILERPTTALSRYERPPTAQSTYSKRSFIPSSRPTSPPINESHIHPLFRSDSPTPAPGTTPGTVVTAHTIGGQVMPQPPPRSASRMSGRTVSRAGSRNPSPATTFRAPRDRSLEPRPSFSSIAEVRATFNFRPSDLDAEDPDSRSGTMTSQSTYTGTLIGTTSASARSDKSLIFSTPNRSRSVSPNNAVARPMTPPIPEFILSVSRERLSAKNSKETLRSARSRETLKPGG
jgi:hypothetical protein